MRRVTVPNLSMVAIQVIEFVTARPARSLGMIARMRDEPGPECWLSDALEVRSSRIDGLGLFAARPIPAGEIVSRLGGRLVTDSELNRLFSETTSYIDTVSVYSDRNLVLPDGSNNHAGNHSCDPNTWWLDPFLIIARRGIASDEEITIDYASITDDTQFSLECRCGAANCRGVVTGTDWRDTRLQTAYGEHWVPVLRDRIAETSGQ